MVHQWHLNVSWFDSQVKREQAAFPTRHPVILPSRLASVDLQYLLWHFSGSQVVKIADAFNMLGCLAVVVKLYPLWNGSMNETCFGREWKQWSNTLSLAHLRMTNLFSNRFFEEARQSSFDWLIWIGETKTAAVSTDALNGQFPVQTRYASDMVGLTLKVTMLGLLPYQCGLQGSSCLFFQKTVEFPTPPAERKRYPNVSLCRGNNLEDYLNRLGGTKVHNEWRVEAGEGWKQVKG